MIMTNNLAYSSQRIHYLDYMKSLAMILVIMGHVNFANNAVKEWIYAFHMPAFFFCSGFVLHNYSTSESNFKQIIYKRFKRLMIPYFLWAIIYAKLTVSNLGKIIYGSYWSITSSGALSSLWFLPVLFIALLLFYSLEIVILKRWTKILIILIVVLVGFVLPHIKIGYPWAINVAFVAFGFLITSYYTKKFAIRMFHYFTEKRKIGIFSCIIIAMISGFVTLLYPFIHPEADYVLMANARYGNVFFFIVVSLFGSIMLLALSMLIDLCCRKEISWMKFIGQNTLLIFVIQKPIINLFRIFFRYFKFTDFLELSLTTIGTLALTCILCVAINKYLPILSGRY